MAEFAVLSSSLSDTSYTATAAAATAVSTSGAAVAAAGAAVSIYFSGNNRAFKLCW
jgi:hypothetical protein